MFQFEKMVRSDALTLVTSNLYPPMADKFTLGTFLFEFPVMKGDTHEPG
jgi:hypothetical protein